MADNLSEFYSGPMLAPNRVGNQLVQAQIYSTPQSVAQMYAGTPYTPAAAAPAPAPGTLTTHTVTTVPIDANGNPAVDAINAEVPHSDTLGNDATRPNMRLTDEVPAAAYANPPSNYGSISDAFSGSTAGISGLSSLFNGIGISGSGITSDGLKFTPAGNDNGPGFTSRDRIGPLAPTPGLVTGAAPSALVQQFASPAAPPPPPTPAPGTSFLQDRGVNTTSMNDAQVANALRDALGGSHRGSFN